MAALGYPITEDNIERVQDAMNALVTSSVTAQARIQTTLSQLSVIDGQIGTARNGSSQILGQLRGEAQRLANGIAIALNLPVQNKVYAVSV